MFPDDPLAASLGDARRATRDQVTAVWQTQMDHIRDFISRDWREQIARIVEERFADFEAQLKPRMLESRREVVRSLGQHWNDCFRRMKEAPDDRQWCEALLDAAAGLCKRCAFFSLRGETLSFQGARGFDAPRIPADVAVQSAPAFLEVALSGRAAETSRSARDLSAGIAALADSTEGTAVLVPIPTQDRVMGVLYVEGALEQAALESIALVAGIILDNRITAAEPARPSRIVKSLQQEPSPASPAAEKQPSRHPRAERVARVYAAQLLLEHYKTIRDGKNTPHLISAIDARRSDYRREFPEHSHYLDAELARTVAQAHDRA